MIRTKISWARGAVSAVFLLAGPVTSSASSRPMTRVDPLTITPHQTATFVADPEAAQLLDDLSEFATSLLAWSDTPREPVLVVGRVVKAAFMPFFVEYNSGAPPSLSAKVVVDRVSAGYRSLQSPRLVKIELEAGISIDPGAGVDVMDNIPSPVPFVISNRRATTARLVLRLVSTDLSLNGREIRIVELKPGQSQGFYLPLLPATSATSLRLVVSDGTETREFEIGFRPWDSENVRVRVLDEHGRLTPARVYFTGADRKSYAPDGLMHRIVIGDYAQPFAGDRYFHTNGTFDVRVPAGQASIEVVKGMEYLPLRTMIDVKPGNHGSIELRLQRLADMAQAGWHSGDVHIHANLFGERRIKPAEVLAIAKAEDLNVVNVLPCNDPKTEAINDLPDFEGAPHALSEQKYILYYNEETRNNLYGHVGFLGLKTFVEPAYTGWPRSSFPHDYPSNHDLAVKAKAQGAAVTYVHPGLPSEYPVDIALGVADTIDVMSQQDEESNTADWYRLLNCGFRCPISAGTDSFLNIPCHLVAGAGRLYVRTGPELTYAGWIDGYRKGRSFATNGPLLNFFVNGHEPGDEIRAPGGPLPIEIRGEAQSIVPMETVEIVVNGRPVKRLTLGADKHGIKFSEKLSISESSWIALRVRGGGHRLAPNDREVYAHTSPLYVSIAGQPIGFKEDALYFVRQIDALIARVEQKGVFVDAAQKDRVVALFRKGQEVYRNIAAHGDQSPPDSPR